MTADVNVFPGFASDCPDVGAAVSALPLDHRRKTPTAHPARAGKAYLANEQTWTTSYRRAEEHAKLTPVLEAKGDEAFLSIKEVRRFDLSSLEGQFEVRFKDNSLAVQRMARQPENE